MRFTHYFFALISITAISLSSVHAEDLSKEAMFTRLSALASGGNADVKYNLGMFLNNGIGTARDNKTAFKYFSEAAESGHELASYKVGCYLAGQFPGTVPVNQAEALKFKLRAAEAGYDLAQFDVGMHYIKMRDMENANLWWERASRQGNLQATAIYLYYSSKGSPDDIKNYALALALKELMPNPSKELLAHIAPLEAKLTAEQKSEANAFRASWFTGKTALTLQAQDGFKSILALLTSLER
ncbi:MAG: tetratricopeptide repeat protein [Candidatus Aquirickettsiella gammari]